MKTTLETTTHGMGEILEEEIQHDFYDRSCSSMRITTLLSPGACRFCYIILKYVL